MRRLFFIVFAIPLAVAAQTFTEGQSTLVYSLPKTELIIQAYVERVTETPGSFYQYSERFLATSNVITSKKTYCRLKSLTITPRTIPDKERTFTVVPAKKSFSSLISVNEQGILCGINVPPVETKTDIPPIKKELGKEIKSPKLLPLSEEDMLAGSVSKMAEAAAKQIYRIRENRVDLLSGDVEHVPVDGASMKTMIEQMNEQESELTSLFTGTTEVEVFTQQLIYTPSEAVKDKVAFRFSSFEGIVAADNLSGVPYYITVSYTPIETTPDEKKKKVKEEIFSIVPVTANVRLDNGEKVIFQQDMILPQLGILMPIPLDTMDKFSKVYISPETGRLLSVEQPQKK